MANQSNLKRLLTEPLFHFIVIGSLFFWAYSALNNTTEARPEIIIVGSDRIEQIRIGFRSVWNRMPTQSELDNLIEEEIREEVYYRDALALGLDKNDAMVRRRLRQKMEFLGDTAAYLQPPEAAEIKAYYEENSKRYLREPQLAFEQIFMGERPDEKIIEQSLQALLSKPTTDVSTLGESSLLPSQLRLSHPDAVNNVFGQGFFEQLSQLPPGIWGGPVQSAYGIHLVRTLDGTLAMLPPLAEIQELVIMDWKNTQALKKREQDYTQRRARYSIEIIHSDASADTQQ